MGAGANTEIEIAGTGVGDFGHLHVTGGLKLDGVLFVNMINGHSLSANEEYLIIEVDGALSGQFIGLGEGDLVGTMVESICLSVTRGETEMTSHFSPAFLNLEPRFVVLDC